MIKIKYDINLMKFMTFFENFTKTKLKDVIEGKDHLTFVLEDASDMGQAIGRGGANIRALEAKLKRKIKIVAFDTELSQFVRNLIYPIEAKDMRFEDGILTIFGHDMKSRGLLIGREAHNLNALKAIVQRYFDVKDIKVQ
jgi:N utilization substance protein A